MPLSRYIVYIIVDISIYYFYSTLYVAFIHPQCDKPIYSVAQITAHP